MEIRVENKYRILKLKRPLKCFNLVSILSRWAQGPLRVRYCAQSHWTRRRRAMAGTQYSTFSATCFHCCSLLLSKCSITQEFFSPWVQMRIEGSVWVVLSELNVPSANENERLIRFHNHSLRLKLPSLLHQLLHFWHPLVVICSVTCSV